MTRQFRTEATFESVKVLFKPSSGTGRKNGHDTFFSSLQKAVSWEQTIRPINITPTSSGWHRGIKKLGCKLKTLGMESTASPCQAPTTGAVLLVPLRLSYRLCRLLSRRPPKPTKSIIDGSGMTFTSNLLRTVAVSPGERFSSTVIDMLLFTAPV